MGILLFIAPIIYFICVTAVSIYCFAKLIEAIVKIEPINCWFAGMCCAILMAAWISVFVIMGMINV